MADGDLLTQYYPVTPYNFDVPPNPYLIGPLKSILQVVETRIIQLYADIAAFQQQVSVQNATGVYLDAHGVLYSTPRLPGEPDNAYRPRILEAIYTGKLTLIAIQAAVTNYLNSTTTADGLVPTSIVYDLASNPTRCAQDAANGQTIELCDFVIEVDRTINENDVWFQDYSYLDYNAYLVDAGTTYNSGTVDPQLKRIVGGIQAGGTNAIFKDVLTITN